MRQQIFSHLEVCDQRSGMQYLKQICENQHFLSFFFFLDCLHAPPFHQVQLCLQIIGYQSVNHGYRQIDTPIKINMRVNIPLRQESIQVNLEKKKQQIAYEEIENETMPTSLGDPNFPLSLTSISANQCDHTIVWAPAEKNLSDPNYSEDIGDLQQPSFCNKALTHALLLINWFIPQAFSEFFEDRKVKAGCLFEYKVMINGVILRLYIDSMIPYKDGQPIFAKRIGNSIFPCLYQKLLAKAYGSYQAISQNTIDLLELLSCYSKQVYAFYQHTQSQYIELFSKFIQNGDLVFFRTRNSIGLQTLGIESDYIYIITRFLTVNGLEMAEFLEIDGEKWVGKFSKVRSFWQASHRQIQEQEINISEESKQNFIQVKDLINLTREFIVLHNTSKMHKRWLATQTPKNKYVYFLKIDEGISTQVMLNAHFGDKNCRSTMFLLEENRSKIQAKSFKENKNGNFIQSKMMCKRSYLLYVYVEDQQGKSVDTIITLYSSSAEVSIEEISTGFLPEQKCFINLMEEVNPPKTLLPNSTNSYICVKNLHKQLGMGFITVNIDRTFNGKVRIAFHRQELSRLGITVLNTLGDNLEYFTPNKSIIMFKIRGKFEKGDAFPPPSGLQVLQILENKHIFI